MHHVTHLHSPRRPWVAWVVLWVWLLAALAPVASHALVAGSIEGPARLEVCTSNGAQWLTLALDAAPADAPTEPAPAVGSTHCPWCLQPCDSGAAPPPHTLPLLRVPRGHQTPVVWQALFFPTPFFLAAAPRGPPARA
jgi:hypothetical protein